MSFVATAIFTLGLAVLAIANPLPSGISSGMAMPLTRQSRASLLDTKESIDLAGVSFHLASVRDKILHGLDNYEKDTGRTHPFAMNGRSWRKRDANVPLTNYKTESWIGEISIGTPAETFTVEIDTGSSDMFVFQIGCDYSCENRNLWDPYTSDTAEFISNDFQAKYVDGAIATGGIYSDNVTIAGYMADPQFFGAATAISSTFNNPFVADGVLGLGLTFSSNSNPTGNLFATLSSQNKVFNPTFSLMLSSSGGELYIGGSNSQLYNGVITYTSVIYPPLGLWMVSMDDIRVGDAKILEDVSVVLDTGSNFIFGDWNQVATLYSYIDGKLLDNGKYKGYGYYYLPCNSFPTLEFTFGGRSFEISPDVFRGAPIENGSPDCFGSIVASDSSAFFWSMGVPFLQGVYTVFDYSTSQVGFADLA